MLRQISVIPDGGSWFDLPIDGFNHAFFVKDIQGLDPVKSTMVSSSLGTLDGEQHQTSRRDKRNIIIRLGFDSSFGMISELRRQLYARFMPKTSMRLRFIFEDTVEGHVDIVGKVESFTMPLFVQEPEAIISVLCYDPDFYVPVSTVIEATSNAQANSDLQIVYPGTVDTGLVLRVSPDRQISSFQFYATPVGGSTRTLNYNGEPLNAGDVVEVSTRPGSKSVNLLRAGSWSSVLRNITLASEWALLAPGLNRVRLNVEGSSIPYTIDYRTRHGGL